MPSAEHEGLVDLFRDNPDLAAHLLERAFGAPLPPHSKAVIGEATLDRLVPVEFSADLLIVLKDAAGKDSLVIIVEAQLGEDPAKKYSWLVYAAVARARHRCQACVLVVTPDAKVGRWAAEPIEIGLGRGTLAPFVLGPKAIPRVTDPGVAREERELAVLSALAHGNDELDGVKVVMASLAALEQFDADKGRVYLQVIYQALSERMREALEAAIMEEVGQKGQNDEALPNFAEMFIRIGEKLGEKRGKTEGKIEGKIEGKREGKIEGKREALLVLLRSRDLSVAPEQQARIDACKDASILDRWIERAVAVKSASELFA